VIITKILKSRRWQSHAQRKGYAIYIDEALAFTVSEDVLLKFGLRTGMRIDEKTVELIASAEALQRAKAIALNFLSYRPRSSKEIINKLLSKGFSADLAKQVVQHMQSLDLLDDLEFARMFVRDKLRGKPMGKAMMRRKLMEKGIAPQMVERVLGEYISDEDEQQAAAKLLEKKLKRAPDRFSKLDAARQKKRLIDYLLSRGFSSEVATRTVRSALA
jgi:regulatory protein